MPYKSISELPDGVRNVLPVSAQQLYMKAFNWADANHPNWTEGRKHTYAWGVVKKVYRKAGTKWVKKNSIDALMDMFWEYLPNELPQ